MFNYYLYTYNNNDYRIVRTFAKKESILKKILPKEENDYNSEEVQRCSISRSKRMVREIALCNDFQFFCTFTVNSKQCDRYNLEECQEKIRKIFKKIKRRNKDFRYIFITEKHQDNAYHFHGLCTDTGDLVLNTYGYLSSYEISTELGFNSFSPIKDYTRVCNYITKYITKDCIKNSHNQVYFCSKGLKRASREELSYFDMSKCWANDYCAIKDIRLDKLTNLEKIELLHTFEKNIVN